MSVKIKVNHEQANIRLDKFLCQKFDISFGLAQKVIREKKIKVNGKRPDASYKINESDEIEIFADLKNRFETIKQKPTISKEKITKFLSCKIFEDENLIAINKPSGLAVQAGSGIDISLDDILQKINQEDKTQNLQLVHRLDKDTSGILLIAKGKKSAEFLVDCFKNKTIAKTYLALVYGDVKKESGVINIPLRKKFVNKNEKVYPDFEEGKEAITNFKLLKQFKGYALLELNPITGRTHQIRVHCKEIGNPVLNDIKYGGPKSQMKNVSNRLCLHAYKIKIENYFGSTLCIDSDLPEFLPETILKK